MKRKIMGFLTAVLFCLSALMFTSCGGEEKSQKQGIGLEKSGFPATIIDSQNRRVVITKKPERIVSLSPSNTDMLYALGLGDRIVGVTSFCDYPEDAKSKPKIGGFADPNMELIMKAEPDLVVANSLHAEAVKQLEGLGVPVIIVDALDINDVLKVIEVLGKATGSSDKAGDIISKMEQKIKEISNKVADLPENEKPRVYFEIWHDPLTTGGKESFLNNLIETAGGKNVASDVNKDWIVYSPEVLLSKDPQIIIYISHFSSEQTLKEIRSRSGWQDISAVKNNHIYKFPDENIVIRPGTRIVEGLEILARMFHPELFK